MCQLNLYMVPKNVPKEKIISIFKKYDLHIVESHYKLDDKAENYKFYSNSSNCDCLSIISKLQEESVGSFNEYKIKKRAEEIETLNRMKKLKGSKDYEARVKEFQYKIDKLWKIVSSFNKQLYDYETEESERIFALKLPKEEQ